MALQKPNDSHKGIELTNTYNRIKYAHFDRLAVKEPNKDENGEVILDTNGEETYTYSKKTKIRIVVVKYKNEEDSDKDENMLSSSIHEFEDDEMVRTNGNNHMTKLYLKLKKLDEYIDCIDI